MAEATGPVTSAAMARAMRTNPVVVRRIMAGPRELGLIRSEKGHGGGWTLARDLAAITLRDVYAALAEPTLFATGDRTEAPCCLMEQAVNAALDGAFRDAGALLLGRFATVTLAPFSADFHERMIASGKSTKFEEVHTM